MRPLIRSLQVFVLLLIGGGVPSIAIERAAYTVLRHDQPYEIRQYPSSVVATVAVDGTRDEAVSAGFRLLADYIFGNNQSKTKIAMTAPVTQNATAPVWNAGVSTSIDAPAWNVRFMMPSSYSMGSLPGPNNRRVKFQISPRRTVAAIQFSGFWSDSNFQSHEEQLRQWIQDKHLKAISSPTYAYYDPPWTPWFLRTIEILVDLEAAA